MVEIPTKTDKPHGKFMGSHNRTSAGVFLVWAWLGAETRKMFSGLTLPFSVLFRLCAFISKRRLQQLQAGSFQ